MKQHLASPSKANFEVVRVILEETYNKSVCLDLESHLIRWFSGDGHYRIRNRNDGVTNSNYYRRAEYRETFRSVFDTLRESEHLFQRTVPQIENTELFKYSPFKSLTHDQAIAVEDILEGLFQDLSVEEQGSGTLGQLSPALESRETGPERDVSTPIVIQGSAGTGKTIVAIYLLKLLCDIRDSDPDETMDNDTIFSDYYTQGYAEMLQGMRLGLVVPQQSLRTTITRVFKKVPGMEGIQVMTPFQVGESQDDFDLLVVDEAHRLNQRANQASGPLNKKFADINTALFGEDSTSWTQLDWIRVKSRHSILLLDQTQSVRPADLPAQNTRSVIQNAQLHHRFYRLQTQMRIREDEDYLGYIKSVFSNHPPAEPQTFRDYDLRLYSDFSAMREKILELDERVGLCRVVAGYAWEWKSRKDKTQYDIEIDGVKLRWNGTLVDWISSANSSHEMGSIHTVQGYDLNWAGVVIGPDIRFDETSQKICFERDSYFDKKGRENNPALGIYYSDEDILQYVLNAYHVLLTRGIQGTYVYACDPALQRYLSKHIPAADASPWGTPDSLL
ncbi:AAA family ATPase [Kocuria tytonicola]|nr:AAA family ATPase [Kocuria tytonicola]